MSRTRFAGAAGLVFVVSGFAACAPTGVERSAASSAAVCIASGSANDAFADYVDQTGGVQGAGLVKTPTFSTTSADGNVYETRCYERRVLEFHPTNACDFRVQGRLLGAGRLAQKYPHGAPDAAEVGRIDVEAPTHFRMRGDFVSHWEATGGLAENGWPISDYFSEPSETEPGKSYLVQYFERAVFESHPENDAPYDVLGKLLGNFDAQCEAARLKPSVNIRMAAFIPGNKPGTSGPTCERVNFGNVYPGGAFGGIFNTNQRGFDYDLAMTDSKLAIDVELGADGRVLGRNTFATTTCRYNDDGGNVFSSGDDWCRKAAGGPVQCQKASDGDVELTDVYSLGETSDDRVGWHAKVHLRGPDPLVPLATVVPIEGWCEVKTYFEKSTGEPVDIYAKCEHKAFPSYELYVAGVQVMTHSAFSHSPGDLGSPLPAISTTHHCFREQDRWTCPAQ